MDMDFIVGLGMTQGYQLDLDSIVHKSIISIDQINEVVFFYAK